MKNLSQKNDYLLINSVHFCVMDIHIGNVIKQVFSKSKMKVTEFAEILHCDRSNIYNIFNRKTIDTDTLWMLSKIFKHNFFEYYNMAYKEQFPDQVEEPAATYNIVKKRTIMMQVELTEEEYQELISKVKK